MTSELLSHKQMFEKYTELRALNYSYPYFYKLQRDNNWLYFLGAQHSNNPADSQFEKINALWEEFLTITSDKPRLVLVEGGITPIGSNKVEAIEKYAEPGYTVFLASNSKVSVMSPEPPESLEVQELLQKYDKEAVAVYFYCNMVSQWQRFNVKEDLDTYVGKHLGYYFYKPEWQGFDFSPTNLKYLYKRVLNREFDEKDEKFVYEQTKPTDDNISGRSSDIRDTYILSKIIELWLENNLFIVYGSGHAIRQEQALRQYSKA
jgi:hypothetical protein